MKFFLLLFFGIIISNVFSQNIDFENVRPGESVEFCTSHKKQKELLKDPVYRQQFEAGQLQLAQEEKMHKSIARKRGAVYTIPVVFHVLHSNGSENISDDQIYDAMAILNRDYRLLNEDAKTVHSDFKNLPTDVQIEFKLATIAPNGACFKGITRTFTNDTTTDGFNQVNIIQNGNDVYKGDWTGYKYLHVYVCKNVGGAAGYTYRPYGSGSKMNNGIWILHNYVGSIGTSNENKSRALTHEVGHWLNLMHTWGGNNNPGNAASCNDPDQDEVDDTPKTIGVTWCNLNENSCGPRANVENYMDYSYCSKMFTPGQVERMRTALLSAVGGRSNISTVENLTAVGVLNPTLCKVDFQQSGTSICSGYSITFTDISYNNVVKRKWLFPGGIPSESTDPNPVVTYITPGKYTVSLTVSDGSNELTKTVQNAVTISSLPISIPFLENFKKITDLSNTSNWSVVNIDNNQAFKIYNGVGYSDSVSIYLNNYKEKTSSTDALISNAFDLSSVTNQSKITLSFRYAYRKKNKTDDESLKVYLSSDCGNTWFVKRVISGNNLDTNVSSLNWIPISKKDWKTIHLTNITSGFWTSSMRIKFEFVGNGGNNIFIDDINLYPSSPSDSLIATSNTNSGYNYTINKIDFITNQFTTCLGSNTKFNDESASTVTNWKWSFPGAFPSSSIEQNPEVIYTKSGKYNVTLTVSNGVDTKTITKNAFVTVDDRKLTNPILETFDTIKGFKISNFWSQINGKDELKVNKESNGNFSAFVHRTDSSVNTISLQSKQLQFLQIKDTSTIHFSFSASLHGVPVSTLDTLSIFLSDDCGLTWNKIKSLPGSLFLDSLAKDSTQLITWKNMSINDFDKKLLKQFTLVRFDFSGKGNWFIDNIGIQGKETVSIVDVNVNDFNLYPNPTDNLLNIIWENNKVIQVEIIDLVGKLHKLQKIELGNNQIQLNCDDLQSGSYFIQITTENGIVSKPFIVNSKN
jgi:PKD repeat protein